MDLYVGEAFKHIAEEKPFEVSAVFEPQQYNGRVLHFSDKTIVSGTYCYDGKAFTLKGKVKTVLASNCARCFEPYDELIEFTFDERFVRQNAPQEDSYCYMGDTIFLDEMVLNNLFLELPMVSLCTEDCKGLCPNCGTNLNLEQCSCSDNNTNSAFSALKNWQNLNKEV